MQLAGQKSTSHPLTDQYGFIIRRNGLKADGRNLTLSGPSARHLRTVSGQERSCACAQPTCAAAAANRGGGIAHQCRPTTGHLVSSTTVRTPSAAMDESPRIPALGRSPRKCAAHSSPAGEVAVTGTARVGCGDWMHTHARRFCMQRTLYPFEHQHLNARRLRRLFLSISRNTLC